MSSRLKPMTALEVQRLKETAFVGGVPGLQLVVSPGGTRSWRLFYRLPGSTRRRSMTLGRFPDLPLAEARRRAAEKLALACDGEDPKAERVARVSQRALSVEEAAGDYLAWCRRNNEPASVTAKESALRNHLLASLGNRPLVDLTRGQLAGILDGLGDRQALRRALFSYLSHFLGWCVERELIAASPLAGLKPPRAVRPRDRVLSDREIAALWQADGAMATIARLSLLTAQRKGSIEAMAWDHVDLERLIWTIPAADMKSGKLHEVPLSAPAAALLRPLPRLSGPHVFGVGSDGARPYAGTSNGMEALRKRLGNPDWRLHDLRRTAVTLAQRAGCSIEAIRALTQHKMPGVIGVYARHAYAAEKRAVVEAIAGEVSAVLDAETAPLG